MNVNMTGSTNRSKGIGIVSGAQTNSFNGTAVIIKVMHNRSWFAAIMAFSIGLAKYYTPDYTKVT